MAMVITAVWEAVKEAQNVSEKVTPMVRPEETKKLGRRDNRISKALREYAGGENLAAELAASRTEAK